jgi:hypothetical protein
MSITPNMNMLLPTVTVTPGPTWAQEVNAAFGVVDSHNHTAGQGNPVPTSGLNINADLNFNSFNGYAFRSTRFAILTGTLSLPTDLACLYSVNGDLYYNSGAGIPIQLTIGGALNATSIGGIGGDYVTSGASVSYSSANQTFTFWQSSGVNALLDVGPLKIHAVGNANYVTFGANASMVANYTLTLPVALPLSGTSFLMVDNTGAISDNVQIDNTTIKVVANQLVAQVGDKEHNWELNGNYGTLTFPQNNIDAIFFAQQAITITAAWIYSSTNGTSGITEFDLKTKSSPSGAWTSIFGANTGKIAATTALTSLSGLAGVATGNLNNHGFVAGDSVTISGVTPSTVITSLTSTSGVATVTLAGHGYVTGNYVTVSGATPAGYNGTFIITTHAVNTFTYAVPLSLTSPATGTISITGYNGVFTLATATTNSFTYAIPTTLPGSPLGTPAIATRTGVYTDSGALVGAQAGVTKPVLSTTAIPAGGVVRFDLLQSMNTGATDARIRIYYTKT